MRGVSVHDDMTVGIWLLENELCREREFTEPNCMLTRINMWWDRIGQVVDEDNRFMIIWHRFAFCIVGAVWLTGAVASLCLVLTLLTVTVIVIIISENVLVIIKPTVNACLVLLLVYSMFTRNGAHERGHRRRGRTNKGSATRRPKKGRGAPPPDREDYRIRERW